LRERFAGQPENVTRFFFFIADQVRELMAQLGYRTMDEMIGQVDRLRMRKSINHWKASSIDLSALLFQPDVPYDRRHTGKQDHGLDRALDMKLLELAEPAIERGERVRIELPIENTNRTVGTILGSEISRKYGLEGLPDGTIEIEFKGSAGQSLGAWLPKGITIRVEGDANDYVGKGLSGGRVIVRVPPTSTFEPTENIIAGNVLLYGATGGEAFFQGLAGERFCVRNSGAEAVVEGVGDHGCEYMTGGRAIILGETGRNFAAGMSGGIAYVLDEAGDFPRRLNPLAIVDLESLGHDDVDYVQKMLRKHFELTRSTRAEEILRKRDTYAPKFVKVYPQEYKAALAAMAADDA
jgi:glutamate synthase domain-containing protein 3